MKTITIDGPQGVGDLFWVYQRLAPHFDTIHVNICVHDFCAVNTRAAAWAVLWPKVGQVKCKMVSNEYYDRIWSHRHDLSAILGQAEALYGVNHPLEQGVRLEDTDPYPVEWGVDVRCEEWDVPKRYWLVYVSGSLVGWNVNQWAGLLAMVGPTCPVILVGADYDRRAIDPITKQLKDWGFDATSYIDMAPAKVCHLIKHAEYFVCYQSGLGILADNYGTRQYMVYFPQLEKLRYAWCQPGHEGTVFRAGMFSSSPLEIAAEIRAHAG